MSFSGRRVLDDVSFSVRAKELTGLIGANGAGKTTLLRIILGLLPPHRGVVELAGRRRHRLGVGYVPQRVDVEPDVPLRARDLVALGLDGHRLGLPVRTSRQRLEVEAALDAVGASDFCDTRVGHLSGGELKRVLIAHAVVARPPLLVLDEPLANLDLRSTQEVVELLGRLRAEGLAVLVSSHELNPLLPVLDRVVYLAGGRAVSGPTDEVIRSDVLSSLYGHHVDVLRVHGRIVVTAVPEAGAGHHDLVATEAADA